MKKLVWNKYIGEKNNNGLCQCCQKNEIYQKDFHCSYIKNLDKGGKEIVENMFPSCALCYLSINKPDMEAFIEKHGFSKIKFYKKKFIGEL